MKVKQLTLFSFALLMHKMCVASMPIPPAREMYQYMDYQQIFNQQSVLDAPKFKKILDKEEGINKEELSSECSSINSSFQQSQSLEVDIPANTPQNNRNSWDYLCFKVPQNAYVKIPDVVDEKITPKDLDLALIKLFEKNKKEASSHAIYMPCYVQGIPAGVLSMVATAGALGTCCCSVTAKSGLILAAGLACTNASFFTAACMVSSGTAYYRIHSAPTNDPIHQFEELYAKRKRFLAPSIQNAIESKFGAFRKSNVSETAILDYCKIALNLPIRSKEPSPEFEKIEKYLSDYEIDEANLSPALKSMGTSGIPPKKLIEVIDTHYFSHSKSDSNTKFSGMAKITMEASVRHIIITAIVHHIANYMSEKGENPKIKNILFLQGLPGIGKTKMIKEIAQLMGLPLITIDLGSADQVRIMGTNTSPGLLLEGLTNLPKKEDEPIRNSLLFLDEMDRIVNQPEYKSLLTSLLPFFEPSTKSIYNAYLGADIDISHYFIIGAGNSVPNDPALQDRMTIVPFKGFKKGKKVEILKEKLPNLLSSFLNGYNLYSPQKISEFESIIDQEEKTDTDTGLRSMEKKLTYHIAQDRYVNINRK